MRNMRCILGDWNDFLFIFGRHALVSALEMISCREAWIVEACPDNSKSDIKNRGQGEQRTTIECIDGHMQVQTQEQKCRIHFGFSENLLSLHS